MKVKELIEKLKRQNPENVAVVESDEYPWQVEVRSVRGGNKIETNSCEEAVATAEEVTIIQGAW